SWAPSSASRRQELPPRGAPLAASPEVRRAPREAPGERLRAEEGAGVVSPEAAGAQAPRVYLTGFSFRPRPSSSRLTPLTWIPLACGDPSSGSDFSLSRRVRRL